MDSHAASAADKAALYERRDAISASLAPATPRAAAALVAQMFLRFPASANSPDQAGRVAAYASDLRAQPPWAIQAAIAGMTGQFAPSSADLLAACRRETMEARNEIAAIDRVLNADVYRVETEAERERVSTGFRRLTESIGWHDEPRDGRRVFPPPPAVAEAALNEAAANHGHLPSLSSAALEKAGFNEKRGGEDG